MPWRGVLSRFSLFSVDMVGGGELLDGARAGDPCGGGVAGSEEGADNSRQS